jgi:hypothetical protein
VRLWRPGLAALAAFAFLAAIGQSSAQALVRDVDYWKRNATRKDTVHSFVYRQSPQAVPTTYSPVSGPASSLTSDFRQLPSTHPRTEPVWRAGRTVPPKIGLSPALRALGTVGLAAETFDLGWKIGTGINAKFLRIGVPANGEIPATYTNPQITFRAANERSPLWYKVPVPEDAWVWSVYSSAYSDQRSSEYRPRVPNGGCQSQAFTPPAGFTEVTAPAEEYSCLPGLYYTWPPLYDLKIAYVPEDGLKARAPIEDYTTQPYTKSSPAPTPPAQSAVEQSIESELEKPENAELRQWLNYKLGSPGERDPVGSGVNVPQPAVAPGEGADVFVEKLEELGLTNVKFKVLSNPERDPEFSEGAVVRVAPPPGTSVQPGEEIVVTGNRTAQRANTGECDRGPRRDPGGPPSGDVFSLTDTFSGNDPDQGMAPTDVPFRWGTTDWGYRHVEIGHGWDNDRDRVDTQAALLDPVPEPDSPGSHRFYFFYLGPNRVPCTRRVVARFDIRAGEFAKRGVITSFAHPGWFRRNDFGD